MAAVDLELLFQNEKNRWDGVCFEFNEPKPSSTKEQQNTPEQTANEPEPISSNEEGEVAKTSNFLIVVLEDYDIANKTLHFIQINHVIKKLNTKSTEAEEKLKKSEFDFTIALKILVQKTITIGRSENITTGNLCPKKTRQVELPKVSLRFLAKSPEDSICYSPVTGS